MGSCTLNTRVQSTTSARPQLGYSPPLLKEVIPHSVTYISCIKGEISEEVHSSMLLMNERTILGNLSQRSTQVDIYTRTLVPVTHWEPELSEITLGVILWDETVSSATGSGAPVASSKFVTNGAQSWSEDSFG